MICNKKCENYSKFYSNNESKSNHSFLRFLFPLYPYRVYKTTKFLITIAVLLALRIIFGSFSVPIPATGQSISLAWIPVMIMGWIFGPVHGLFFGVVTDSLCFLIKPSGVWFWMYAIQEPIIGLFSGIARSIYERRITGNKKLIFDFFITQIILVSFILISLIGILLWVDNNILDYYNSYKYVCISLSIAYFIIINCFMFFYLKNIKNSQERFMLFLYGLTLISVIMIIFSLLLGPISTVEYLKYVNGKYPKNYVKYGLLYYFIPRAIVQTIKVPFEAIIFCSIVLIINPILNNSITQLENSWW